MEPRAVDLLITNAQVLTFDDRNTVVRDGAIAVAGDSLVWIGKNADAASLFTARETLDARGQIAMPGLIDCHVHTAQQFLRGKLASLGNMGNLREPIWQRYLIPFESGLEPQDVYCSGLAAYASMISCGTTCFLEAGGPYPDEMGRAADEIAQHRRRYLDALRPRAESKVLFRVTIRKVEEPVGEVSPCESSVERSSAVVPIARASTS